MKQRAVISLVLWVAMAAGVAFATATAPKSAHLLAQTVLFRVGDPHLSAVGVRLHQTSSGRSGLVPRCPGNTPRDCDRPGGMPTDTSKTLLRLAGSDRTFTVTEITSPYNPADWFPNDHPPMPDIVAHGKEATRFRACAICHYPNGQGLMQNGPVAGLPVDYFLRQIADFASGRRMSADLNKANAFEMAAMARNLTPEEARAAAEYFASMPFKPWIRVVESETVPVFTATVNGLFLKADGTATEPLGRRLDRDAGEHLREQHAPQPALRHGRLRAGGEHQGRRDTREDRRRRTYAGLRNMPRSYLKGTALAPPIAGRQPGYMARQMYDFQQGTRNGEMAQMMKPAVEKLTGDDLIAIPPTWRLCSRRFQPTLAPRHTRSRGISGLLA